MANKASVAHQVQRMRVAIRYVQAMLADHRSTLLSAPTREHAQYFINESYRLSRRLTQNECVTVLQHLEHLYSGLPGVPALDP